MDAWRTPLPPASRPIRIGQPYHGLLRGSVLSLSTGGTLQWLDGSVPDPDSTSGDCYVLRVPGTPAVGLAPGEVAAEAAAGRQWRDYALLTGRARAYAGIAVGSKAWLYADAEGAVWRIECDMLDGASLTPTRLVPDQPEGIYPATADFTFAIRRFGVIDPDDPDGTSAPTRSITLTAQSLGAAHASDPIYWDGFPAYPARLRHFPGDGVTRQYMPINIEDINSTGSHAIFCVNRTAEQGAVESIDGRGVPKSWLGVAVSGVGLDDIEISMSVLRVQTDSANVSHTTSSSQSTGAYVWDAQWVGPAEPIAERTGDLNPPPDWPSPWPVDAIVGAQSTLHLGAMTVGAYFDRDDSLRWVESGDIVVTESVSGAGVSTNTIESFPGSRTRGDITYYWCDFLINVSGSCDITALGSSSATASMGSHTVSLGEVGWTVSRSSSWSSSFVPYSGGSFSTSTAYSISVAGGALGDYFYANPTSSGQSEPVALGGAMVSDANNSLGVRGSGNTTGFSEFSERWYYGHLLLRAFDGLVLTRISNKVYGAVALGPVYPHSTPAPSYPAGSRVVALGTPDGWVTGSDVGTYYRATYQPVTGQLAGAGGWV